MTLLARRDVLVNNLNPLQILLGRQVMMQLDPAHVHTCTLSGRSRLRALYGTFPSFFVARSLIEDHAITMSPIK